MSYLSGAASLVIGIATVLTYYTALLHLNRKKIGTSYKFRSIRDLLVGTQTLQLYFISKGLQLEYPFLLYPFITLLYISGSLSYIRYYLFLYPGGKVPRSIQLQVVPSAIIFAGETWFYVVSHEKSQAIIRSIFTSPLSHWFTYVILVGVSFLLVQYALLLRLELGFTRSETQEVRDPVILSSVLTAFYLLDIILISTGFLLADKAVMDAGILLLGLTGIVYLLFENRYPSFYQLVAREEKQKKYKKSIIQGLSKEKILVRLQELMEDEKIYRQLELKLDEVAEMLLITPHQLSEFLNDQLGVNFSTYVNQYRVKEAKDLLVNAPDKSILSIAFDVGFGSKPSFNTIFKQQTGMTPSEFRKKV